MSSSDSSDTAEPAYARVDLTADTTLRGPYFYSPALFPELAALAEHVETIAAEARAVAGEDAVAAVDPTFAEWADDKGFRELAQAVDAGNGGWVRWWNNNVRETGKESEHWTVFGFVAGPGEFVESNMTRCPRTAELLRAIPSIRVAGFSRLLPGAEIKPHKGFTGREFNALAFHMGLAIPRDGLAALEVGPVTHVWRAPGETIVFDDCFVHRAYNRSLDTVRVVLYIDFAVDAAALPPREHELTAVATCVSSR